MKPTHQRRFAVASLLLTLGAAALPTAVHAQAPDSGPPPPRPHMGPPPGGGPRGPGGPNPLGALVSGLELTAEEKIAVQPILDAATPQIKAIRDEAMARTDAVVTAAAAQIRPLLTAEQQVELDAFLQRLARAQARAVAAPPP